MQNIMDWFVGGFVNWKTTITGLVAAALVLLKGAGVIHLSDGDMTTINAALIIIFSWFAKDSNTTGKPSSS